MAKVKRYDPYAKCTRKGGYIGAMLVVDDGDYVSYADYLKLKESLAEEIKEAYMDYLTLKWKGGA